MPSRDESQKRFDVGGKTRRSSVGPTRWSATFEGRARRRVRPASHFCPPARIRSPLGHEAIGAGVEGGGEAQTR